MKFNIWFMFGVMYITFWIAAIPIGQKVCLEPSVIDWWDLFAVILIAVPPFIFGYFAKVYHEDGEPD